MKSKGKVEFVRNCELFEFDPLHINLQSRDTILGRRKESDYSN